MTADDQHSAPRSDVRTYTSRDGTWDCQEWWDDAGNWHGGARCTKCQVIVDMGVVLLSDHQCQEGLSHERTI